jgi:hypothetical protein
MAETGGNIAGFFTMTRFIYMSLYVEFCNDKQNSHGSTTTLQPHMSLKNLMLSTWIKTENTRKMLQHQTQVLQHYTQNTGKKGNILGNQLINASGLL